MKPKIDPTLPVLRMAVDFKPQFKKPSKFLTIRDGERIEFKPGQRASVVSVNKTD